MKTSNPAIVSLMALAGLSAAQNPTTSLRPLMIYDSHHQNLDASVVRLDSSTTTYRVSCPTAAAADNDACRAENYYPADIVHADGSMFAGTNTATASVTKYWTCRLGSGSNDTIPNQYGVCDETTVGPGAAITTVIQKPVNQCFVMARSVPVMITAGMEKVYSVRPQFVTHDVDADGFNSVFSSLLKESACPPFTNAAAVMTTPSGSGPAVTTPPRMTSPSGSSSETGSQLPGHTSTRPSGSSRLSTGFSLMVCSALVSWWVLV